MKRIIIIISVAVSAIVLLVIISLRFMELVRINSIEIPKAADYKYISYIDWQSPDDPADGCMAFWYNDRLWLYYADAKPLWKKHAKECVGSIVQNGVVINDSKVASLTDSDDLLVLYTDFKDIMASPISVYRASDTRGKEINDPSYLITSKEGETMYNYWSYKGEDQQ